MPIVGGIFGILFGFANTWFSNYYAPPDFKTMLGLTVMACSATSLIAGLATVDIVNAISRSRSGDRNHQTQGRTDDKTKGSS